MQQPPLGTKTDNKQHKWNPTHDRVKSTRFMSPKTRRRLPLRPRIRYPSRTEQNRAEAAILTDHSPPHHCETVQHRLCLSQESKNRTGPSSPASTGGAAGDGAGLLGGRFGRGGRAAEVRGGAGVPERGAVPVAGGGAVRRGAGPHRHDAGRALPARLHGGGVLAAEARVLPRVHPLPLPRRGGRRRRGGGGAGASAARGVHVVPVAAVRDLPVPRRCGGGAHLGVRARRARGAAQLRAEPPGGPAPALRAAGDLPRLRRAQRLWETRLPAAAVVAAPECCHADFSR
jgi:hypothetical protein